MTSDLLLSQATNLGWEQATISYYQSSEAIKPVSDAKTQLIVIALLLIFVFTLMGLGTMI